jgi:ribosomal protein S18 acetylase RimI-like enzyme
MPNPSQAQTPAATESVEHRIRQVSATDQEGIARTTALHMDLLNFGPMAQFGDTFIRRIGYEIPLRDNLLHVAVAEVEGQPAGFIAYTDEAHRFHSAMFRDHFIEAGWLMGLSLLQQPKRVMNLPRAVKVVLSRDDLPKDVEAIDAEVICFGVQPDYLTPAFVRRTGLKIGVMLLDHAFAHFRAQGHKRVRMIVDADNRRALLFYHTLGATFTPCMYGGVESVAVAIDL